MDEDKKQNNPRDHLANERTFLAWIRTSIGIMGFGLVVVKLSLFEGYSGIVGIALVVVGGATAIVPYFHYKQVEKQLNEGCYKHSSLLITILTAFIFLVSVFLIVYFIKGT